MAYQVYSHRNGETEPPTLYENGAYYWYCSSDGEDVGMVYVLPDGGVQEPITFRTRPLVTEMDGQWWGPVTPPWEQENG